MIFHLSNNDFRKLKALLETANWNIDFSEFINGEILNGFPLFNSPIYDFAKAKTSKDLEILPPKAIDDFSGEMKPHLPYFKYDEISDYEADPLYKYYQKASYKKGKYNLSILEMDPYTPFLYDQTISSKESGFCEVNKIGYFKETFHYPALSRGDTTWMSLLPFEINTARKAIEEIRGNVLVHGLGLGYVPARLALKDDVTKVTVIENDPVIIEIFNKAIKPALPSLDKLVIEQGDSLTYKAHEAFDYEYIDIYHNEEDGLLIYSKMIKTRDNKSIFWIEETLLTYLRRVLIELIAEELEEFNYEESDQSEFGHLCLKIKKALRSHEFKSYEEILDFLSSNNLKSLLRSL